MKYGWGGNKVYGKEGASGLDPLHQFGVAGEKPLQAVGARESRAEGERGAGRVKVQYGTPAEDTMGRDEEGGKCQVGVEGTEGG